MTAQHASNGDFIVVFGAEAARPGTADALLQPALWQRGRTAYSPSIAHRGPAVLVVAAGDAQFHVDAAAGIVGQFDPTPGTATREELMARMHAAFARSGTVDGAQQQGGFAAVLWGADGGRLALTDLFRSCQLYVRQLPDGDVAFSTDLRLLAAIGPRPALDARAVYHLLNLYYVPTPLTMFQGIEKVPPATVLAVKGATRTATRYWHATYPENRRRAEEEALVGELRGQVEAAVRRQVGGEWGGVGAFLSGGTDSSTICGVLASTAAAQGKGPVRSFSIGFAEEGYDELGFCRIVARHYGLNSVEGVVSAADTLEMVQHILTAYDEPAGNASSIPTMACTRLANELGVSVMLGGDGGDEIFGGNERYRKDAIMGAFYGLPSPVKSLARGVARVLPGDSRFVNRVRNFVKRSSVPNPDRFYMDDAFASECYDTLLTPQMRALAPRDSSLDTLREVYARADARSELHKLMFIDLERTISDNDILKVTRAARANGVRVRFPFLDRALVEFTGTLADDMKVRGPEKRYLFKRAVTGILPQEILVKKKQGFGLPVSVWFQKDPRYLELLSDTVLAPGARLRALVEPADVRRLLERHRSGAWEHGAELWALLMIELWMAREGVSA